MKNKLKIKHHFNMIEVVLAMAVIALAMTSVLALLPVGLNASRDAINLNYSADAVANFVGRIKSYISTKDTATNKYRYSMVIKAMSMYLPGDPDYTTYAQGYTDPNTHAPPTTSDVDTYSKSFATDVRNGVLSDITGSGTAPTMPSGITKLEEGIYSHSSLNNCYFIIQGRFDSNGDPIWETHEVTHDDSIRGKVAVDLIAMIYIWRRAPLCSYEEDDSSGSYEWKKWPLYPDNFKYFTTLNIEVSWPLAVEYSNRERSYFSVEFTNPDASEY
jgi:type II secretory pathway pseudopilin PulG